MSKLSEQLINGLLSPMVKSQLTCDPITLTVAGAGMAVGGAGMNIYGQFQARDQHNAVEEYRRKAQEDAMEENRRRATYDYLNSTRLEQTQQQQETEAVAQKSMDVAQQATRSVATGVASAAERGVAGRTVDQIAQDFDFMANEETGRIKANQELTNQQHAENIKSYGVEYNNRVASMKPYVKEPAKPIDFFGPIFGAGSQILNTDLAVSNANPTAPTVTNWLSKK